MQCLELISYGIARLCFIVPQPSQFLLRLHWPLCTKKVVTLALHISGAKNGTVTHEILKNTAFIAFSNDNNNKIF